MRGIYIRVVEAHGPASARAWRFVDTINLASLLTFFDADVLVPTESL
jgi:hypothetical protein